ncbi:hypothetical protein PIB30_075493 [Stylosanthes scabra]|uniref:Uncharacterized protein n=1 Tax=Stylosanthes scabra TaxID=79078 RepID=A0ABU6XMY0_9FABA|nr:hypothetical protein [Stylosanthes scabra]
MLSMFRGDKDNLEGSKGIIEHGDGMQEDMPSMEDTFDSIPEKLSDPGPCMVNCKVGNEDLNGCMCDPRACVSIMPLTVFEKLKLGPLKDSPS